LPSDYSNWCPEIYRGLFIDRHNNNRVLVAPCCQAQGSTQDVDTFDFNSNKYLTQLRDEFSQGQRPKACQRCWNAEDLGVKSRRQSAVEFFNIDPDNKVVLQGLDYNATWACNSACIMCGPQASSLWATELGNVSMEKTKFRSNRIIDKLELSNLKKAHFNGGEPLLTDDHLRVLSNLALEDLFVSYNTNGTIYPSVQAIELWKRLKLVKLFFSIDAVGKAFEYIRWPAKWNEVEDNLLKMKEQLPSNVMFGFNITVGVYNLCDLTDLIDWINQNLITNREGDKSDVNIQIAYNFDPAALSDNAREKIMSNLKNCNQLSSVYNYLLTTTHKNINWIKKLEEIDGRRSTDWRSSLKISEFVNA